MCINRYWNSTFANYTINTTVPGCNGFADNVAFNEVPQACRIKNIFAREIPEIIDNPPPGIDGVQENQNR